jgi:putative addiction module component (TIGR02574 family)
LLIGFKEAVRQLITEPRTRKESQMSIEELEAEIKKLNLKDRAALAKWIVESLDELSESEIEALWAEEAERRLDELEQGMVTEIPAEEVLRRARAAIS